MGGKIEKMIPLKRFKEIIIFKSLNLLNMTKRFDKTPIPEKITMKYIKVAFSPKKGRNRNEYIKEKRGPKINEEKEKIKIITTIFATILG